MTTPAISIVFFPAAALFGAVGQYLYKSAADMAGMALLVVGMYLMGK